MWAAKSRWSIRPRHEKRAVRARLRALAEGRPDGDGCITHSCASAPRLPTMASRRASGVAEPAAAPTALAADHAGHDFRRGRGGLHALNRSGRAAESDGADRTDGRSQSDRGSEGDHGVAGSFQDSQDLARTYFPGLPHNTRRREGHRGVDSAKAHDTFEDYPESAGGCAGRLRREPELHNDWRPSDAAGQVF